MMSGGLEERIEGTEGSAGGGLEQRNGMVVGLEGLKVLRTGFS